MLDLTIKCGRRKMPIFDLPIALGRAGAAKEIADQIDGLIAFLDDLGGDPDIEADGDELDDDNCRTDFAYPEWDSLASYDRFNGKIGGRPIVARAMSQHEDAEDEPDCCEAGDDDLKSCPAIRLQWADRARAGDEDDAEFAWPEWHTRGRHKVDAVGGEFRRDGHGWYPHEDYEDDDRDTGVEDGPKGFDPEEDRCTALDDVVMSGVALGGAPWHMAIGCEDDAEAAGVVTDPGE